MQTFLPYPNFRKSALALDKKRCWKQVVEAHQIIDILEGRTEAWKNHPAVHMWQGSVYSLKIYFNDFLEVCITKHHINTKYEFFTNKDEVDIPWWLGDENFHRAMRARLIVKDRSFYLPRFPEDEGFNEGKYLWPVMDGTYTFKII